MSKLKNLGLSANKFFTFPMAICKLVLLEKIYLGQDQGVKLTLLPQTINQLRVRVPFYAMYLIKSLYIYHNTLIHYNWYKKINRSMFILINRYSEEMLWAFF